MCMNIKSYRTENVVLGTNTGTPVGLFFSEYFVN